MEADDPLWPPPKKEQPKEKSEEDSCEKFKPCEHESMQELNNVKRVENKINRAANKSMGTRQEEERKRESAVKIKPTTSAIKRLVNVGSLSRTDSEIKEGGSGMIHLKRHILMG